MAPALRGPVRAEHHRTVTPAEPTGHPDAGYLPLPEAGRVFTGHRRVRLGDAAPGGRVRFDALARYLQDVAEDDAADAGWPPEVGWVVRKTRMQVRRFPSLGERLRLETFCSGRAAAWAERTTTVTGEVGGSLQATSVWVAVDSRSGRPARLGDLFDVVYAPSAAGRRASARLHLPALPAGLVEQGRPWPLRISDFDAWKHVNNAISWSAVEDALAAARWPLEETAPGSGTRWPPVSAELEHHEAIEVGGRPTLCAEHSSASVRIWLTEGTRVLTAARLRTTTA